MDLTTVYDSRFSARELKRRNGVWRELVRFLHRYIPDDAVVLDLACGRGDFINNVRAKERWALDIRDVREHIHADVRFVVYDGLTADSRLELGSFDVIFLSNYLEHLASGDQVVAQLIVVARLLRPGGRVIILQPNVRLVGGHYWDFLDHRTALTERSLEEASVLAGLVRVRMITRFLPFSTKARVPQWPWLVRLYLNFPPAWLALGRQTLFIAERPLNAAPSRPE
jgi:2-polyprenyl-3-methyl-5-hydroxy-6-metoxy-1,4-benzoquinol methylase